MGNVRINKAKKFNGKPYVGTDELDKLIAGIAFGNNTLTIVGSGTTIEGEGLTSRTVSLADLVSVATNQSNYISVSNNEIDPSTLNTFLGTATASRIVTTDAEGHLAYANEKATVVDGTTNTDSHIPTVSAVKTYVDNKAINVVPGAGITIDSTNVLSPKIAADIDSATIVWSGSGDTAKLSTGLKLVKKGTANTGYAASYQLCDNTGAAITNSADIDIVKDQFIKSAAFGWSTAADSTGAGWTTTKSDTAKYPCIKIEVWTNIDGTDDSSSQAAVTELYIPLNDVFQDKTAGNGIDATALASNVIQVKLGDGLEIDASSQIAVKDGGRVSVAATGVDVVVGNGIDGSITTAVVVKADDRISVTSDGVAVVVGDGIDATNTAAVAVKIDGTSQKVVATSGAAAVDVITVSSDGIKVANIQSAINAAVDNEHLKMATAVSAVDGKVIALASSTNSAVTDLNARIVAVASNAEAAANALEGEIVALDTKVDGAFDALDSAIETAVDAVQTSVTAHTANAVQMLESDVTISTYTDGYGSATITANNIVAVYEGSEQVYPDISRTGASKPYTYTLGADFGSGATGTHTWTVLYTVALESYTAVDVADTTYAVTTSAAKTVANGDAATAPTPPAATTVGTLDYLPAGE